MSICFSGSPSLCFILFCCYSIYVLLHSCLNKLILLVEVHCASRKFLIICTAHMKASIHLFPNENLSLCYIHCITVLTVLLYTSYKQQDASYEMKTQIL